MRDDRMVLCPRLRTGVVSILLVVGLALSGCGPAPVEAVFPGADWERIALIGGHPITFEQDINHPRRWQELLDQPNVRFGSHLVNDYENPWPPDW